MNPQTHTPFNAQAMVLAAGRGVRMRPLTDTTPKPLLEVRGFALMHWHLAALAQAGVRRTVINTAWLEAQVSAYFGTRFHQLELRYSHELRDCGGALETAGGIVRALPHLDEVFWVVAGDVFAPDFPFAPERLRAFAASGQLAHLWLVPNPEHHPRGDFGLSPDGLALNLPEDHPGPRYTYSTIALFRKAFFRPPICDIEAGNPHGDRAALAPMLRRAMDGGLVGATLYDGAWTDVGTPDRLAALNATVT